MRHIYSKKQKEFIRKMAPGRYNNELTLLFNQKFDTQLSVNAIKSFKVRHHIKSDVPRNKVGSQQKLFSHEQKEFIYKNVKNHSNIELTNLINQEFHLNVMVKQVKNWKQNNRLSSGLTGQFIKGYYPVNKGDKGGHNEKIRATQFTKGHQPKNHRMIGSERLDKEGYLWVKVAEPRSWELKHRIIWEKSYGKISRENVLIFADGDKTNVDLDNLLLVSRRQLIYLNRNHWITPNQELTKVGLLLADLSIKVNDRE